MKKILLICFTCLFSAGCASTNCLIDRKNDLKDVFTATVGTGAGAKIRVGPFAPGLIFSGNYLGLQDGDIFSDYGKYVGCHGYDAQLILWGGDEGNKTELTIARHKYYESWYLLMIAIPFSLEDNPPKYNPSYFTQLEIVAGLGGTIKLGFNPGELVDFFLGWFGIDIYKDDIELVKQ